MHLPCPRCHQGFTPGDQFCTACGTSLLLEASLGSAEPTCAVHPQLRGLHICGRCGAFACARCLRANALGEAVCASCHEREPDALLPWDRREELGTLKAFWKTCVEVLLRPGPTFSASRSEASVGSSLLFVALCYVAGFLTTSLVYLLFFLVMPLPQEGGSALEPGLFRAMMAGALGGWLVLMPFLGLAITLLNAGVDHLVLKMGGIERGYAVTLRGNALSQAPYVLGLIPLCGMQVAPWWALVARVFAYRGQHRTTWGVAAAGALAAPLLSCLVCGGGYAALVFYALSASSR